MFVAITLQKRLLFFSYKNAVVWSPTKHAQPLLSSNKNNYNCHKILILFCQLSVPIGGGNTHDSTKQPKAIQSTLKPQSLSIDSSKSLIKNLTN